MNILLDLSLFLFKRMHSLSLSLSFSLSRYVTTRGQLSQFGQPAECQMAQLRLRHDAVIAFSQNGDDLRLND